MSDKGFNWKSLFINEETNQKNEEVSKPAETAMPSKSSTTTFPSAVSQPQSTTVQIDSNNPYLDEIFKVYEKGFEGLNSQGFDFFELYKSVSAVGISNPQSYQMAFTMGKTINPTLTKDFLIEKANYYLAEIEKVYSNYASSGNSKLTSLKQDIQFSKGKLADEVKSLEASITDLQNKLNEKKMQLENVEVQREQEKAEIEQKIIANDMAKSKLVESINSVVLGIKQNL